MLLLLLELKGALFHEEHLRPIVSMVSEFSSTFPNLFQFVHNRSVVCPVDLLEFGWSFTVPGLRIVCFGGKVKNYLTATINKLNVLMQVKLFINIIC